MRTVLVSIMTFLFLASAASACPLSGHSTKEEVKKPVAIVGS